MKYLIGILFSLTMIMPVSASEVVAAYGNEGDLEANGMRKRAWHVIRTVDDFDDDITITLLWVSGDFTKLFNFYPCSTTVRFGVNDRKFWTVRDNVYFKYRIDDNKAGDFKTTFDSSSKWALSDGGNKPTRPLLDQMLAGNTMIAKVGDGDVWKINLDGLTDAWEHSKLLCNER